MSHFTTLVITKKDDDPETLLAPFTENVEKGEEYAEFEDTEDSDLNEFNTQGRSAFYGKKLEVEAKDYKEFKKNGIVKIKNLRVGMLNSDEPSNESIVHLSSWTKGKGWSERLYGITHDVEVVEKDEPYTNGNTGTYKAKYASFTVFSIPAPQDIPFNKIYKTFEEYKKEWCGEERDEDMKRYGYWHNPNAQWDWYVLGGRWSGMLKAKKGVKGGIGDGDKSPEAGYFDSLPYKDIDWEGMKAKKLEDLETWWAEAEKLPEDEQNFRYGIRKGMTKEEYIKERSGFTTHAVITSDGEWNESGKMGWWGIVTDEKNPKTWEEEIQNILSKCEPDDVLSVYDLHI